MDLSDFDIKPGYFMHASNLHGAMHTYRVMCHTLALGNDVGLQEEKRVAFFAAFIHDMARKHDGFCLMHGPRAAKLKVPEFTPLFQKYRLDEEQISTLKTAVANHSQYVEIKKWHPHYTVTALLKDADALDRIRIGEHNLNRKFLRFEPTFGMIADAERLFYESEKLPIQTFQQMLNLAEEVLQKKLQY